MTSTSDSKRVLEAADIARALKRIAHEISERNRGIGDRGIGDRGIGDLAIVGIRTRGVPLAARIAANLELIEGRKPLLGALDIALHRDDYHLRAALPRASQIGFDVSGKKVVLVDDVLFTGRTIKAALDALGEYGRPASVQLAVLIDRGHRELPIRADFVGKNAPTSRDETIAVRLMEIDGSDEVLIEPQRRKDAKEF